MSAKIHVLCGMISSGKSTYAKNAARTGAIIVNDDAIVKLVHGDDYTLYDEKLKILYKTIENHIIGTALALNRLVLVDRGLNLSLQGRKRWLALANSLDVFCEAITFQVEAPEIHANRRMEADSRGHNYSYWLSVAKHHYNNYTPPSLKEGFDAVHVISFAEIKEGKVIEGKS
jgi:predicted kinase